MRVEKATENGLANKRHGLTGTPEYKAWQSMRDRCSKPQVESYQRYGARGISVYPGWENSFENFYRDMGPRPGPEYSLDRLDNDGDYTPENCRWADVRTQANNRSVNRKYVLNGEELTLAQISEKYNINYNTLYSRVIRYGMSIEEAVKTDIRRRNITYGGKTQSLAEWAREFGMNYNKLYNRVVTLGWSLERAVKE